jgi:hypothetical protein
MEKYFGTAMAVRIPKITRTDIISMSVKPFRFFTNILCINYSLWRGS